MILRERLECVVASLFQFNFLPRFRLGMTDDTGPLHCASRSWILGRVSFKCTSQRAIDPFINRGQSYGSSRVTFQKAFSPPPVCLAVSFLSPLTSSHVPATKTTFTGNPIVRCLPCDGASSLLCFPSTLLQGSEAPSPRASPFRLECRMHLHCHPETTEQLAFRVFGPRPISPTQEFS